MRWVMLGSRALASALAGVVLISCSAEAAREGPDTLVLEVGGEHASLRSALLAAGVVIEPPRQPPGPGGGATPRPMAEMLGLGSREEGPAGPQGPGRREEGGAERPGDEVDVPSPPPPPAHREVELQSGDTISHLSSRHLGTVRRYREILELNGWTEAESRQLPIGTLVKLPNE